MVRDSLSHCLKETSNSRRKSERIPALTGKEPYVFRAEKPGDLPDIHADLMRKTLRHDEGILYLLYSPISPEENGPFGLSATPGSHSVAVTKRRFVISENQHRKGAVPTIQSIPFRQVLYVELGNALFFGWFSIQFVVDNKPSHTALFFSATTGMKHFGIAVRKYRNMTGPAYDQLSVDTIDWADIWRHTPKTEVDHVKPLIIRKELPFNMLRSSERWILRKRLRKSIPVYLSRNGILVSTNFGLIHATDEPCTRPEIFGFGVNASCIAFGGLKSAQLLQKSMNGRSLRFLQLKIARGKVTIDFDIPFDGSGLRDAESLVYFINRDMPLDEEARIS